MVAAAASAQAVPTRPRLVVGIVVEGLEQEQIDLLRHNFGQGGFNRMLREGAIIENADYGSAVDATAATAMIFTGAAAGITGVPAAEIFDRTSLRTVPTLTDPSSIGNFTSQTFSPRSLAVTTIADEAKIAGSGVTYAYAIAPEPAQAIIMAGHAGNSGMWLNENTANWATTTYYKDTPTVMTKRNHMQPLRTRLDTMQWAPLFPSDRYVFLPDHLTRYPFRYTYRGADRIGMFKNSPAINTEITALAIEHLNALSLGRHPEGPDMLSLAYTLEPYAYSKQTDNRFEQQDAYFRLDRDLEQLFSSIDKNVGLKNSLIFLAATPPSGRTRRDDEKWQLPFGEFSTRKAISLLNMYLMAIYGNGDWVQGYHNGEFFLNHQLIQTHNLDLHKIRAEAATFLKRMAGVAEAYSIDDILAVEAGRQAEALRRNTDVNTAGDVRIAVMPGWEIVTDSPAFRNRPNQVSRMGVTTAPVYIMASEVAPQRLDTPVDIRVVAPTVTRLMRIRSPNAAAVPPLNLSAK